MTTLDPQVRQAIDVVARSARALHASGAPADRMEHALTQLSERVGLHGQFFSTPTSIMMSLRHDDEIHTRLERLDPGTLNLEQLDQLDSLLASADSSPKTLESLARTLDHIESDPPRFGPVVSALGTVLVTASAACIFGGNLVDVGLTAGMGLAAFLITFVSARVDTSGRLSELLAAFVVAFTATLAATRGLGVAPAIVTAAALIQSLPGLNLTTSLKEIAAKHFVSGASRLAGTWVVFLTLGTGAAIGTRAATVLVGAPPEVAVHALAPWAFAVSLVAAAVGFGIVFRALPKDFAWIVLAVGIAFLGTRTLIPALGPQLGTGATSFLIGMTGNLFARTFRRAASVIHVPGLILLVPGVAGFQSLGALFEQDTLAGVQAAFAVVTVGVALAMGLLLASALLPPRRSL